MDILTIGGVTLPAPNEYKVKLNDLDSSDTGRTEDGVMMRNRVREGIAKISASWAAVSTADCDKILTCRKAGQLRCGVLFWRNADGKDVCGGPQRGFDRGPGRERRLGC